MTGLYGACLGDPACARRLEACTWNYAWDTMAAEGRQTVWDDPRFRNLYSIKARSMLFNLKNPETPGLRRALLEADSMQPYERLVAMTHAEMHPALWEPTFRELHRQKTRGRPQEVAPDHVGLYQCNRCRSWRCTFNLLQTRASDEPATAFCLCHDCGVRWRMAA